MIGKWTIQYTGKPISLNDYKSKHWKALKKIIDPFKLESSLLIKQSKIPPLKWFELTLYHNTRLDMDNITGTIKPFVDCLRKQNIITDDTSKQWDILTIKHDRTLLKNTMIFEIIGEINK